MLFKKGMSALRLFWPICILLFSLPYAAFAANGPGNNGRLDYDLDNDGLIEINDLEDLNEIRNNLDGKTLYGKNVGCPQKQLSAPECRGFELTEDLNFDTNNDGVINGNDLFWNDGKGWSPIGTREAPFSADFKGNGFSVANIFINRPESDYIGLFGFIEDGAVSGISFNGDMARIEGGTQVGTVAGQIRESSISRIESSVDIFAEGSAGGIVGSTLRRPSLRHLVNMGNVTSESGDVGGIASRVNGNYSEVASNLGVLRSLVNTGNIATNGTELQSAGGLFASVSGYNIVSDSFSTGAVSGKYRVGALIGSFLGTTKSEIRNTFATGFVYSLWSGSSGGLVASTSSRIYNSYWATDLTGTPESGITAYVSRENDSYAGLTSEALRCATQANITSENSSCVSSDGKAEYLYSALTLYKDWDESSWEFGTDTQLPGLYVNGVLYRDADGDGKLDANDRWPENRAASTDYDRDSYPDFWTPGCDAGCRADSGLNEYDHFPQHAGFWQDSDLDGYPDSENMSCTSDCGLKELQLDASPNDFDNDGITDIVDIDDNNDGIPDIDGDSDGLVEIHSLPQLNAMRYQMDGAGYRSARTMFMDSSGCPARLHKGRYEKRCKGYELTSDLDFDSDKNGVLDSGDEFSRWVPVGNSAGAFSAVFDGNGHTINNLNIESGGNDIGLFGIVLNSHIRQVGISGDIASISGTKNVGALVGRARYGTVIESVFNTAEVTAKDSVAGGIVGYMELNTQLHDAFNTGAVTGPKSVGGIVGSRHSLSSILTRVYSHALITADSQAGGIVGSGGFGITNSYWAREIANTENGDGSSEENSFVGVSSFSLKCAIAANTNAENSNCVSADGSGELLNTPVTLYRHWDEPGVWNFGSSDELPELIFNRGYIDNDNDGVADALDAFPDISLNGLLDTDNDGRPDSCDIACMNTGMSADDDDDGDGIPDVNDGFPLISVRGFTDTDNDGIPDTCSDAACKDLRMTADLDDDNDGVNDEHDAYPLISLEGRNDNDSDGLPDECDQACIALGMAADNDDDNDGVSDDIDGYPFISIEGYRDTDADGIPDQCHFSCDGMRSDRDDDGDNVPDTEDRYPLIPLGDLPDNDADGQPDTCDQDCRALGMYADSDDDNDGISDNADAYPLISLNGAPDTDRDGVPDDCAQECLDAGMIADIDDDDDGIEDINDGYPLIPIGSFPDADNDGRPDICNQECLDVGMVADNDKDNDGVIDSEDAYPLISLNGLTDTDHDGRPDDCDNACRASGMSADGDDDGDGIDDNQDAYPLISLGGATDTDNDGIPDNCEQVCLDSGMVADSDDDNDGIADAEDGYPVIHLGSRADFDGDGRPDVCDQICQSTGMQADDDADGDGISNEQDAFNFNNAAAIDADNDGFPDVWASGCDRTCQNGSGLQLDSLPNDTDNDGAANDVDNDLNRDNGKPELLVSPDDLHAPVNNDAGTSLLLTEVQVDQFFAVLSGTDIVADDDTLTFKVYLNGVVLERNQNDGFTIPSGLQVLNWVAVDASGNESIPREQRLYVYPQVRFEEAASVTGEGGNVGIIVELTGDSPEYPVHVGLKVLTDQSTADELDSELVANEDPLSVTILAGVGNTRNRQAILAVPVAADDAIESDETLVFELVSVRGEGDQQEQNFALAPDNTVHTLTITDTNLAPEVDIRIQQGGINVPEIKRELGEVILIADITDKNARDTHRIDWTLGNLVAEIDAEGTVRIDLQQNGSGDYEIVVVVTDSDVLNPLSAEDRLILTLPVVPEDKSGGTDESEEGNSGGGSVSEGGSGGGGGALWWTLLILMTLCRFQASAGQRNKLS